MADHIKKEDLEPYIPYICIGRCPSVCYWNPVRGLFEGIDFSCGMLVHDKHLLHWDDDDHYGTVKPMVAIDQSVLAAFIRRLDGV